MGSKKLVYCCIIGILLGFIAPLILKTDKYLSLMIGMIAGLGVGYLLDTLDSRNAGREDPVLLNEKAEKANRLMERARRGVENEYLRMDHDDEDLSAGDSEDEDIPEEDTDTLTPAAGFEEESEEQAQKLSEAEELLRAARERMK